MPHVTLATHFAQTDANAVTLALIAIIGSVITALFKLLSDNTKALKALVDETAKGNREAKERNGHLGEQSIQIAQLVKSSKKDVLDAVQHVQEQHVHHQQVEKADVAAEHVTKKE